MNILQNGIVCYSLTMKYKNNWDVKLGLYKHIWFDFWTLCKPVPAEKKLPKNEMAEEDWAE